MQINKRELIKKIIKTFFPLIKSGFLNGFSIKKYETIEKENINNKDNKKFTMFKLL